MCSDCHMIKVQNHVTDCYSASDQQTAWTVPTTHLINEDYANISVLSHNFKEVHLENKRTH